MKEKMCRLPTFFPFDKTCGIRSLAGAAMPGECRTVIGRWNYFGLQTVFERRNRLWRVAKTIYANPLQNVLQKIIFSFGLYGFV